MATASRKQADGKYANRAYVVNYPPLDEWLKKHNARCNWQVPVGGDASDPRAFVESWMLGKGEVIVMVRANKLGWNIFTALPGNGIEESLADAEKRLGL